jgi:protein involved in temperature-dependent protein secretion
MKTLSEIEQLLADGDIEEAKIAIHELYKENPNDTEIHICLFKPNGHG